MLFERDSQKEDLKINFESSFVKNSKFGFISKFQIFLMVYFQWFQNCSIHQKSRKSRNWTIVSLFQTRLKKRLELVHSRISKGVRLKNWV